MEARVRKSKSEREQTLRVDPLLPVLSSLQKEQPKDTCKHIFEQPRLLEHYSRGYIRFSRPPATHGGTGTGTGTDEGDGDDGLEVPHLGSSTRAKVGSTVKCRGSTPPLTFKAIGPFPYLLAHILEAHGFSQTLGKESNLVWCGQQVKGYFFRTLMAGQKINSFPRSWEATRKDCLSKNMAQMAEIHGKAQFDFIPETFVLPDELPAALASHEHHTGPWICKPAGSCQGRNIFITEDSAHFPAERDKTRNDDRYVLERYVSNPLLVNGLKFDLRIYVCVTSICPLRIYRHSSGLVRFASREYAGADYSDVFAHLTNYSINKKNTDGIGHDSGISTRMEANTPTDPSAGAGSSTTLALKWTFDDLEKHLTAAGIDVGTMWSDIDKLIVKSLIGCEPQIRTASDMFCATASGSFQLFGFDVLLDENIKPWLLEINFAPSLAAPSTLDLDVKSAVLCDMLNVVGIKEAKIVPSDSKASSKGGLSATRSPYSQPLVKGDKKKRGAKKHMNGRSGDSADSDVKEPGAVPATRLCLSASSLSGPPSPQLKSPSSSPARSSRSSSPIKMCCHGVPRLELCPETTAALAELLMEVVAAAAPDPSVAPGSAGGFELPLHEVSTGAIGLGRRGAHAFKFVKSDERKILLDFAHELSRAADGGLRCLFPNAESPQYRALFESSVRDINFTLVRAMFVASFVLQHNRIAHTKDVKTRGVNSGDKSRSRLRAARQTRQKTTAAPVISVADVLDSDELEARWFRAMGSGIKRWT